jgi:hypothetical protein
VHNRGHFDVLCTLGVCDRSLQASRRGLGKSVDLKGSVTGLNQQRVHPSGPDGVVKRHGRESHPALFSTAVLGDTLEDVARDERAD